MLDFQIKYQVLYPQAVWGLLPKSVLGMVTFWPWFNLTLPTLASFELALQIGRTKFAFVSLDPPLKSQWLVSPLLSSQLLVFSCLLEGSWVCLNHSVKGRSHPPVCHTLTHLCSPSFPYPCTHTTAWAKHLLFPGSLNTWREKNLSFLVLK